MCLACEQAKKISKLEKAMREKDIEIKKMKDIISKLQHKMEEANKTEREADQGEKVLVVALMKDQAHHTANSPRNWGKKLRS